MNWACLAREVVALGGDLLELLCNFLEVMRARPILLAFYSVKRDNGHKLQVLTGYN